jgi:hypothetical protein
MMIKTLTSKNSYNLETQQTIQDSSLSPTLEES